MAVLEKVAKHVHVWYVQQHELPWHKQQKCKEKSLKKIPKKKVFRNDSQGEAFHQNPAQTKLNDINSTVNEKGVLRCNVSGERLNSSSKSCRRFAWVCMWFWCAEIWAKCIPNNRCSLWSCWCCRRRIERSSLSTVMTIPPFSRSLSSSGTINSISC